MITTKNYEKIVQEIESKIRDVDEHNTEENWDNISGDELTGFKRGLELALALIEDYKDWYPVETKTKKERHDKK